MDSSLKPAAISSRTRRARSSNSPAPSGSCAGTNGIARAQTPSKSATIASSSGEGRMMSEPASGASVSSGMNPVDRSMSSSFMGRSSTSRASSPSSMLSLASASVNGTSTAALS